MFIFKTSGKTFEGVIKNQKHAFDDEPKNWEESELVLVSKNKKDTSEDEKQIQYIMKIEDIREADDDEIEKYWPGNRGRWDYLVDCYDTIELDDPFNLEELLGEKRAKRYAPIVKFGKIDLEDEKIIIDYLKDHNTLQKEPIKNEKEKISEELETLNKSYGKKRTEKKEVYVDRVERNPRIVSNLKKLRPNKCQICEEDHFLKENGEPYSEVHHIEELSKGGSQVTDNCLVLCPTCHMKMHHASVEIDDLGNKFEITINGDNFEAEKNKIS